MKQINQLTWFYIIAILFAMFLWYLVYKSESENYEHNNMKENISLSYDASDQASSGSEIIDESLNGSLTNEIVEQNNPQKNTEPVIKEIVLYKKYMNKNTVLANDQYQSFIIDKKIKKGTIVFDIDIPNELRSYGYFSSRTYCFALNIFLGDISNGGYYNTFRNNSGQVKNDINSGLNGCIAGYKLRNGNSRSVPIGVIKVAQTKSNYGYKTLDLKEYINSHIGKPILIGAYLSSIKEFPSGWNNTVIRSVRIEYEE